MIQIPVKVGDTILTGKFKNKSTVIKSIGKDEHGMPTINGRKVVTFRIKKVEKSEKKQMKRTELRKLISEEVSKALNEEYSEQEKDAIVMVLYKLNNMIKEFNTIAGASGRKLPKSSQTEFKKVHKSVWALYDNIVKETDYKNWPEIKRREKRR